MKNIGIQHLKYTTSDNFTSAFGLSVRRAIHPLLRIVLKLATKRKIKIIRYPKLPKKHSYIFASTHYFDEDVIANLATIDRDAWILFGTTNQLEYNRQVYAAWLNGLIYINRLDRKNRNDAFEKMKRVIDGGSSILLYPEGGWNNTENLLVQQFFPGVWKLAQQTGVQVIPVAVFHEYDADTIYMDYGDPLDLGKMEKEGGMNLLRDTLATMLYELMVCYSEPICRSELTGDIHFQFMEQRRQEYLRMKWTRDVWDEELTIYQPKEIVSPDEAFAFANQIKLTSNNTQILAPILARQEREQKYNFNAYMHHKWNL